MRMTRAQAAALAAAGDDVVDQHNDTVDDNNDEEKIESTTGESGEREALAELTHPVVTNDDGEIDAIPGGHVDEPVEQREEQEAEKESEQEQTNGQSEDLEHEVATTAQTIPITNGISIHQDSSAQKELGSPTTELPLLNITPQRTPAKNMIRNEFAHMRSTSNKENMVPGSPLVAAPVSLPQAGIEQEQPEMQTPQQSQPQHVSEQKEDHRQEGGEASVESTQADDGQDDSLVGHFENLSVSPKKQKFSEQEVVPDAEQAAPEQLVDQSEKQKVDATKPATVTSQEREKKASASPVAKKPSTTTSQTDTSKLARKPSVRQSTLGRQSSVIRKSMARPSRPEPSTTTAIKRTTSIKRSSVRPSTAGPRPGSSQSTERTAAPLPANIPHSKPRPMSMSFPTPAPPSKSTKAVTQATFSLPGEAIAAKLKADKEARLLRQAESGGVSKQAYKPPTMQKSTKAPTKATFQLPGEAIAAKLKQEKEDRLKRQEENGAGAAASKSTYIPPVVQKSTKPVTKATFQLSSDVFAAKMKAQKEARLAKQKEEEDKKEKERGVFKARPAPKMSKPAAEVRQTTASRARLPSTETSALGRASSVRDPNTAASKRLSSFHPSASTTTLPPRAATSFQKRQSVAPSASTTVSKGKEVFARAREGKEKEEKEKKEKEEAAKKARSEAAEAGRLRSREWAEKKKREERRKTAAAALV